MGYIELQETIDVLVSENRDLKGKPYLRDELLGCLAWAVSELIEYLESGKTEGLKFLVDNVQHVLKQLPDDIKY